MGLMISGIVPPAFVSGCAKLNCRYVHDTGVLVTGFCRAILDAVLELLTNVALNPFGQG